MKLPEIQGDSRFSRRYGHPVYIQYSGTPLQRIFCHDFLSFVFLKNPTFFENITNFCRRLYLYEKRNWWIEAFGVWTAKCCPFCKAIPFVRARRALSMVPTSAAVERANSAQGVGLVHSNSQNRLTQAPANEKAEERSSLARPLKLNKLPQMSRWRKATIKGRERRYYAQEGHDPWKWIETICVSVSLPLFCFC